MTAEEILERAERDTAAGRPEGFRAVRRTGNGREELYLTFPIIEAAGFARTAFTTRIGGVSNGPYRGVNLGPSSGDSGENLLANYETAASFVGGTADDIVLTHQTHTNHIRIASGEDRGRGVTRERGYEDVDGLVTDVPGLVLCTLHADCTPVLFADPVRRVVGAAHAGWRGTALRIAAEMVRLMGETYGSRPGDLLAAIGPVISAAHYEVGPEVADEFCRVLGVKRIRERGILLPGEGDRSFLDLAEANRLILEDSGVLPEHITSSGLCTYENPELFYSHRAVRGGKRGTMGALITIPGE